MKKILILMGLLGVNALFMSNAMAIIVNGQVTGGTAKNSGAIFVNQGYPAAGLQVGDDNTQSINLFGFNEDQNITLASDLAIDVGATTTIAAFTEVASQYIYFDPSKNTTINGWVEFDSEVLGVITSKATLDASDFLANNGVVYNSPGLRGLESGFFSVDNVTIDSTNNKRVNIALFANSPGDYFRVITARSPGAVTASVPEVESILLFAFGLLALMGRVRRNN